jgi:23S rRNA pseudouridine1911/1915/1917 synthase
VICCEAILGTVRPNLESVTRQCKLRIVDYNGQIMIVPEFEILAEAGPCLVVSKPPGLLTQAPPGIDSLEDRIKRYLKVRDEKPGRVYLGVPHRLDRPASGAMVFAKHVRAARRIAQQFESRRVEKVYWALVEGHIQPKDGTWRDHLRKIPDVAQAEVVSGEHPDAREAVMHYRTLERLASWSWLEIRLETGRMHQIRIQCASRGHPLLGDRQYGASTPFGEQYEDQRLRAIALHSRILAFDHPMTDDRMTFVAPLPEAWKDAGIELPSPKA